MHNALTSWPVPLCTRQVACRTSFLSRQRELKMRTNNMMKAWVDLEVRKPLKAKVGQQKPANQFKPTYLPPLFKQTCSEVGEERDEFSPIGINLPKEARLSFVFFCFFFNYMCNIYTYVQLFFYVQITSRYWPVGGSAEQPLQGPDGRALNQPKPHPSSRIV